MNNALHTFGATDYKTLLELMICMKDIQLSPAFKYAYRYAHRWKADFLKNLFLQSKRLVTFDHLHRILFSSKKTQFSKYFFKE